MGMSPHAASPETLALVDSEVRRIIDECYDVAVSTLGEHRTQLDRLANALLEHETLDEDQVYEIAGLR
jgi:cell division protease FtsH